jgi:SecD-like export protein
MSRNINLALATAGALVVATVALASGAALGKTLCPFEPRGADCVELEHLATGSEIAQSDAAKDIVSLRVILVREIKAPQGAPVIELTFDAASAARLQEFSRRVVGQRVTIYGDGRKLAAPVMRTPVIGDGVQLTGDLSSESRQRLLLGTPLIIALRAE